MKILIKKLVREGLIKEVSIQDISEFDFNAEAIANDWVMASPSSIAMNYIYDMQEDYELSAEQKQSLHDMDSDEIIKTDRFKKWLDYEVEYKISDFIYNIKKYINPNGMIGIWREMTVDDEWIKRLSSSGNRLGEYWSFDDKAAEAHWGGNETNSIAIESQINQEYVDWTRTIYANINPTTGESEKEITLFKNTPIKIKSLSINDKFMDISSIENKIFKA